VIIAENEYKKREYRGGGGHFKPAGDSKLPIGGEEGRAVSGGLTPRRNLKKKKK